MAAATRSQNVIRVTDDNDTLTGIFRVKGILYKPGTSAAIKKTDTNGMIHWETASTAEIYHDVCIRLTGTTHFDLAGSAVLYLYLE
jgi:hypothetical protein